MRVCGVVTSRNDNYGGNLLERAIYSLRSMINTFDEVIYVDWNSPNQISLFTEIKNLLPKTGKVKHIQVTQDFVNSLNLPKNVQACVEVLGKNIAIRRASCDWIAATNIDIIVPKVIKNGFSKEIFYIFARRDITLDEIKQIETKYKDIQQFLYENMYHYQPHGYSGINHLDKWSIVDSCGDFQFAHRDIWHKIRGFEERMVFRGFADSNVQRKAYNAGFKLVASFDYPVFHINHKGGFGGTGGINDADRFVINFTKITENTEDWGFPTIDFPTEIW
jgi:hypothetical protein